MSSDADNLALAFALYGGAQPGDLHLLADIVAVGEGILGVIAERERKKKQDALVVD
jgi:hypothetical protein